MKKYKLKQWYPSLDVTLSVGDIIELTGEIKSFYCGIKYEFIHKTGDYCDVGFIQECEFNNPDFWELIEEEKPLFVTEDGVEITDGMQSVIAIDSDINVEHTRYRWANKKDLIFGSKEGADEYIWRNKPVFSYNDFMKWGNVPFPKAIEQLAKERIEG